jgi:UDP-N-acetylmuramyl pentapeptide synthase
VLRMWTIRRLIARRRRLTAILGVMVVLGVAALNVHAAMPEHHDKNGVATVCVAALSIAVIAAFAWTTKRSCGVISVRRFATVLRAPGRLLADVPRPATRAGPPGPAVLRL